ncbi:MAG: DUF2461 domain-containing protein [bacterium]|nr:MAG: DUF2461 domain-containing protein [bacterium]
MHPAQKFNGFQKETIQFYQDLTLNNDKLWFEQNRKIFDEQVMKPAQAFVVELGERLESIAPNIVADPRRDKSIFRIHRDTRFSKDKSPFKTHLAIFFWEGPRKKLENSGFYLQISTTSLLLAAGLYIFPAPLLDVYREAVIDPKQGDKLMKAIEEVKQNSDYKVGGEHYKKTPRGYDSDHPNAKLLLHNGIYAYREDSYPKELHSAEFVDFCFEHFKNMAPIHQWIRVVLDKN